MESHVSSAAAFVEGGIQDACDDACSICLEAFSEADPSTVTCCKHDYHLQCILEWCQRSSQCPMCWQTISLKDPTSQELLEAVERERNIRVNLSHNTNIFHHMSLGDFGLQHLPSADGHPHVLVFSSDPNISSFSSVHRGSANEPMISGIGVNPFRSNVTAAEMPHLSSTQSFAGQSSSHNQDRAGPSDFNSLSETLKSRLTSASMRYGDSITRSALGWRERFFARNASMSDLGSEVMREVNAGIATVSRIMERLDLREHNTRNASAQQSIQGHAVAETTQTSNERVAVNRNVSAFCSASSGQN